MGIRCGDARGGMDADLLDSHEEWSCRLRFDHDYTKAEILKDSAAAGESDTP